MTGVVKQFSSVRALDGVDLDVRAGEVHCLLGQNGAGKSTLMKVLSAAYQPDEGTIWWDGDEVRLGTPQAAIDAGISTIYQELDLVPGLSVTENIFLGHEVATAGLIRRKQAHRRAQRAPRPPRARRDPGRRGWSPSCRRRASRSSAWPAPSATTPAADPRRAVGGARPR